MTDFENQNSNSSKTKESEDQFDQSADSSEKVNNVSDLMGKIEEV